MMTTYKTCPEYTGLWPAMRSIDGLPATGAGLSSHTITLHGHPVELLLYHQGNQLVGILQYYPEDIPFNDLPYIPSGCENTLAEKSGNFNVAVHPRYRRQRIASKLVASAADTWNINFGQQLWTPSGLAFVKAVR